MKVLNSGRFSMGSASAGLVKKLIGKTGIAVLLCGIEMFSVLGF